MRRNEAAEVALPEESATILALGGDGVVKIRGIGFGRKIMIIDQPDDMRAAMLLEAAVLDEVGEQLYTAEQWNIFGQSHEMEFLELVIAAKRVSGFDIVEVKKN